MKPWGFRAPEVANLVNAPFCSLMLGEFAKGYFTESKRDPDLLLSFIALPMALHRETRCLLPSMVTTKHTDWVEANAHLKVGFPERCRNIAPFVREAIEFGVRGGILEVAAHGQLHFTGKRLKSAKWKNLADNHELLKAAAFSGRWFARAGRTATIYAIWGIKP